MLKSKPLVLNLIFFLQALLIFLAVVEDRISIPVWLEVAGRLHPTILHIPIGLLVFFIILILIQKEFKKKVFRKIASVVLLLTSLFASLTALAGFFLSRQGDYGPDVLMQHKVSGILLSLLCYSLLLLFNRENKTSPQFYTLSILVAGALFFAGHTGGTLTHGENYLLAPVSISSRDLPAANGSVFQAVVYPVLERKCVSCHNKSKAKGKLVMTSVENFKRGGKNGNEWKPGNPGESRLIKYIHLPLEDDDHMPPDGKPQLTRSEISLLEHWIAAGADFEVKLTDLEDKDSLRLIAASLIEVKEISTEQRTYDFYPANEEAIQSLNTPFRSVFPVYRNAPALQADFFIKESFQVSGLEDLKEVREQLVWLNCSKMPVTDSELAIIGGFKNLEKINLNFSRLNGDGLSSLQSLKNLTSLSLAGTEITANSLSPVLALPALKELFIWNTHVTQSEATALQERYPGIMISTTQFRDDKILRLGKPGLQQEGVIRKDEQVRLKHSMPGVVLRYTLDGTNPDSTSALVYSSPIHLGTTAKLKAIACKTGWYCSEVFESICFVEGKKPEHVELLSSPDKDYPGEGAKSLTDDRKGFSDVFKEPSWLGYRDQPFVAGFDFGPNPVPINTIVISYERAIGSYIFPPVSVEVWAGKNKRQLKLIKSIKVDQPAANETQRIEALTIPLSSLNYPYYQLIAKPVDKLPKWHSGKGKKGWVMIDEVFFY